MEKKFKSKLAIIAFAHSWGFTVLSDDAETIIFVANANESVRYKAIKSVDGKWKMTGRTQDLTA